jgi:hypothetical protein
MNRPDSSLGLRTPASSTVIHGGVEEVEMREEVREVGMSPSREHSVSSPQ